MYVAKVDVNSRVENKVEQNVDYKLNFDYCF